MRSRSLRADNLARAELNSIARLIRARRARFVAARAANAYFAAAYLCARYPHSERRAEGL